MRPQFPFLGILENLAHDVDPIIRRVREAYQHTNGQQFIWAALGRATFNPEVLKASEAAVSKLVLIGPLVALIGSGFLVGFDPKDILKWVVLLIAWLVSFGVILFRMTAISDPIFHMKAFKLLRKKDYNLIKHWIESPDFSYGALYDDMFHQNSALNDELRSIHERMEGFLPLVGETERLNEKIREYQQLVEDFNVAAERLNSELSDKEQQIKYLLNLLQKVNTIFMRLVWGELDKTDLRIISDFSLYELNGKTLQRIVAIGTSSPKTIPLDDPDYTNCGAVLAYNSEDAVAVHTTNSGRTLVSKRIDFTRPQKKTYVYNFHLSDINPYLDLLSTGGILETREIYRLVCAIILLLQENGLLIDEKLVRQGGE